MNDINCGVIGAGRIGQLHASLLQNRVDGIRVKTVGDVVEKAAKECAGKIGCEKWTGNIQEVFSDPDIDVVIICSSTDTHADIIQLAAASGKDAFCEKPIAFEVDKILETLEKVEKSGIKLQIGFNRRFDPNFSRVRELVALNEVGNVHMIKITSRDPGPPPVEYIKRSGGLFMDMTIHDFDMARFLSGSEVSEVYARGAVLVDRKIGEAGDIDSAAISLEFTNSALGFIENSRKAIYGYDQRVEVFGSKGMVNAGNVRTNSVSVSNEKSIAVDLPPFFFIERYTESYIREFEHFVSCMNSDNHPSVSGRDGLEPVYIGMACNVSLKENRPVSLKEVRK